MGVEFQSVQHDNVSVLKISGDLDTSTSKFLKKALTELIEDRHYNIVVDMHKVVQIK